MYFDEMMSTLYWYNSVGFFSDICVASLLLIIFIPSQQVFDLTYSLLLCA